jgi:biopolymer transport protein TolR
MIAAKLKRYRKGKHGGGGGHGMPALIPMIDMLVHTADYEILPNTKNISIPQSVSEAKPRESTVMMITRDTVFVDGAATAKVADIEASPELVHEPLRAKLAEASQRRSVRAPDDAKARELTYSVLKKIMSTATAADIGKLSLAVIEKERAYSGPALD